MSLDLDEIEVQPDETTSYTITATDEEGVDITGKES